MPPLNQMVKNANEDTFVHLMARTIEHAVNIERKTLYRLSGIYICIYKL